MVVVTHERAQAQRLATSDGRVARGTGAVTVSMAAPRERSPRSEASRGRVAVR